MKRGKPLRRRTWMRSRGNTAYRRRERDFDFMGFVKKQPCIVRSHPPTAAAIGGHHATPCFGRVEADHMGARGIGQKAADDTTVPMCQQHHLERTTHCGTFKHLTQQELRIWRADAIAFTQHAWSNR